MKKNPHRHSYPLRAVSAVLVLLGCSVFIQRLLSVQTIACSLEDGSECPPALSTSLEQLKQTPILFSPLPQTIRSIDTGGYTLKTLYKKLPSTLVVQFTQAQSLYQVQLGETRYAVDAQGFLQADTNAPGILLSFAGDPPLRSANQLDQTLHRVIYTIVEESTRVELPLAGIHWKSDQEIELSLENNHMALLDSIDISTKILTLDQVLTSDEFMQLTQDSPASYSIDMRFRLPVLRTGS